MRVQERIAAAKREKVRCRDTSVCAVACVCARVMLLCAYVYLDRDAGAQGGRDRECKKIAAGAQRDVVTESARDREREKRGRERERVLFL